MIDVEPRLRDELERWQPYSEVPLQWDDVLARAGGRPSPGRRAHRSRRWLVAVVAALVLLVGGTAYAIAHEFLVGDPAPPAVQAQAELWNEVKGELIPRVRLMGPGIRAEQTRLAASLNASTGRVYLWVAPTEDGNECLFTQVVGTEGPDGRPNLSGGCSRKAPIASQASGIRVRDGRRLSLVVGHVEAPITRVAIELDGQTLPVPLSGRFFLFELPGVEDGQTPAFAVVGYDTSGREVARQKHRAFPRRLGTRPRPIDVSAATPLLEIQTRRTKKPVRLYVIERDGERCTVLVSPGGTGTSCGGRPPQPREIAASPNQIGAAPGGMLLLWGEVGREIERLELRFEDGRVERLPLAKQFTLYQVDQRDYTSGRRPITIIGRNATGRVVAEQQLGPWEG